MFEGGQSAWRTEPDHLVFVTGCYRSGTTLLEKLLHSHPELSLASQPFPILFFASKARFLESRGLQRRYPLDHLFLEADYTPEEFCSFLQTLEFQPPDLVRFWNEMEAYTEGLWTPEILDFRKELAAGTFWDLYRRLSGFVSRLFPKEDLSYVGSKEVLCEEFVPCLLEAGVKVLVVLRDPRAMICSLDFADRNNQTGMDRPILYSLRVWRKSVAIALEWKDHPGFMSVHYEDLVRRTGEVLARVTDFLGIPRYPEDSLSSGIRDQRGHLWQGNSSFEDKNGVVDGASQSYQNRLGEEVLSFIETATFPEMITLGYEPRVTEWFHEENLSRFRDPFDKIHDRFPSDYSHDPSRLAVEAERFRKLVSEDELHDEALARAWFLSRRAYLKMRGALSARTAS